MGSTIAARSSGTLQIGRPFRNVEFAFQIPADPTWLDTVYRPSFLTARGRRKLTSQHEFNREMFHGMSDNPHADG